MSLWDVQNYSDFTVNEAVTLSTPVHITGESSGASAFLKYGVSAGTAFTAYDVQGDFFNGERLLFNGVADDSRYVTGIRNWENSDIKSVFGIVGSASTFSADLVQRNFYEYGTATITGASGGVSTVTVAGAVFPGIVTTGNIVSYQRSSLTDVSYARVTTVNTSNLVVEAVESVSGVNNGALPTSDETPSNFRVLETKIQSNTGSGNRSTNEAIFSIFPRNNVESVDLTNSSLIIRKQFTTSIANNSTPVINADPNEVFLPFDEERYILMRSNGTTEVLTSDKVSLTNGSTSIQFNGLASGSDSGTILIATLRKSNVTNKVKTKVISTNVLIDKSARSASGIGGTTLNDGLTYGNYAFGTRVQDPIVSLNVPDVINIWGIFESDGTADPACPAMVLSSLDGPTNTTNDLVIGEEIVGTISGARATYLTRNTDVSVGFVYSNDTTFLNGEVINFTTSGVNAIVSNLSGNSKEITSSYQLVNGQKPTIYDYSRIVLNANATTPSKKVIVYYQSAFYDSGDTGDITTVNSYTSFNYGTEIADTQGNRNSDIIDARPRVQNYTVAEGAHSPFEFLGRTFGSTENSSKNIIASDESVTIGYDFYLPRADRIYVDKNGSFMIKPGTPDENPKLPDTTSDALNIANAFLPAYLYDVDDAIVTFIDYKRYQMSDISKLEQRIKNIEYYTSLSQLESATINQFIPDGNGLNRFKSGIFVDNFSSLETQDVSIGVKNSIDTKKNILRPSHYSTSINLEAGNATMVGIGTTVDNNADPRFVAQDGTNIVRNGQVITLDYEQVYYVGNPFATRVENVTPFLVSFWDGSIKLEPSSDVWIDVVKLKPRDILKEGNFNAISEALGIENFSTTDGKRQGCAPIIWSSWETASIKVDESFSTEVIENDVVTSTKTGKGKKYDIRGPKIGENFVGTRTVTTTKTINTEERQKRTGIQKIITEDIEKVNLGDRVVSRDIINYVRSRNVEYTGTGFKPYTRLYSFFDSVDVTKFCTPKLLQIEMISGTFEVGETISSVMVSKGTLYKGRNSKRIRQRLNFKVAQANHKYGPFNNPSDTYDSNPYDRDLTLPSAYSQTSTILNIDTFSLSQETSPNFGGVITTGMTLVGQRSGAQAKVTDVKLITDRLGTIQGTFKIPASADRRAPLFETGNNTFRLTSSETNSLIRGTFTTAGEEIYYSQGSVERTQETTLSLRNAKISVENFSEQQTLSDSTTTPVYTNTTSIAPPPSKPAYSPTPTQSYSPPSPVRSNPPVVPTPETPAPSSGDNGGGSPPSRTPKEPKNVKIGGTRLVKGQNTPIFDLPASLSVVAAKSPLAQFVKKANPSAVKKCKRKDPLAQTFFIPDDTGVYMTSVDIFFRTKDTNVPVTVQLREVELGTPTSTVIPYSEVDVDPKFITLSEDGTVPTNIPFDAPVYLNPGKEYAIVLLSHSTEYSVWISRFGEKEVSSSGTEAGSTIVSAQPLLGSLFKSQNATTWTPSQYEDLKFNLYRANFAESGTIRFYNPQLPTDLEEITDNGITMYSRNVRVGLGTTVVSPAPELGNTITQANNDVTGTLVGYAGSATGDLTITNAGVGYTPSVGSFVFTGVALTSITGFGENAIADITIQNGVAIAATISSSGGKGYAIGDVLKPLIVGSSSLGVGMRLSVSEIYGSNELIIDEIQGEYTTLASDYLTYTNSSGVTDISINAGVGGSVVPQAPLRVISDGTIAKVFHRNHGMHSNTNLVTLSDVSGDVKPTLLTEDYTFSSTSPIPVADSTNFTTFENIDVSVTNPGYVQIGEEIIQYTGIFSNTLTGITRAIDNTIPTTHFVDDVVSLYQLNGVSLRRINKTHNLNEVTTPNAITLDSYHIKINMNGGTGGSEGTNRTGAGTLPALHFNTKTIGGGTEAKGTYNIPFDIVVPQITTITPTGTSTKNTIRTISGSTLNGSQSSFVDQGEQTILYGQNNYFNSSRMVASRVNEETYLDDLSGNKSLSVSISLNSGDSRISPAIDISNSSVILISNRINRPVTDYANNLTVKKVTEDPNNFFYVTKNIVLENPATSLQVLLDSYVTTFNDVRLFYALDQSDDVNEVTFIPFPGYKNLGDGTSDTFIGKLDSLTPLPQPEQFIEYKFSENNLNPFKSFRIKIIGTSTNSAVVPQFKNLRCIALA